MHRHAGSNGANSTPSRVYKGKKLPGHMGVEQVTVQNLEVVKVDAENNLIALKGAIPGPKGGIVYHHRQRQGVREGGIHNAKGYSL